MKHVFFLLLVLVTGLQVQAQQPQLIQERNYKVTPNESEILVSAPDQKGNILYSGATLVSVGPYENSFLMVKPNTDTLWTKKNPIKLDLAVLSLLTLPSGGFIAGGNVLKNNIRATTLNRLNANGLTQWTHNQNSAQNLTTTILPMPGKDLLLGGWYSQKDFAITRTDSLGVVKWSKGYPWGGSNEYLLDLKYTPKGNIIAAGITDKPFGPWHLKLMLLNQNGDSLKGKQLIINSINGEEGMDANFNSITPLSDGGYLLTANLDTATSSFPNGINQGTIVKVDSSFNLVWKYIHRTQAVDEYIFTKAKELADGSVIVLGFKFRPAQGGNGFQLYRFNAQGVLKNVYPFTSSICTQTWGVTLDALSDSTFMVGGRCGNNPPITYGFYVAKVKIPGLPAVLPPIMPGTVTGLAAEQNKTESYLGQSYPNPTASTAIIPYTLPVSSRQAQLIIRDITGREVGNYELRKNSSSLEVNLSNLHNLHNGLYTYTLVADGKPVGTKKLAVMK
jgi:hypothetical protein